MFLQLAKKFGSRATFYQTSEAEYLDDITRLGADLAIIFWSNTSRVSAQTIHRQHRDIKIILEQNSCSLSGRGERNGFLSVIERSQDRTQLFAQVEEALNDSVIDDQRLAAKEEDLDLHSIIGRMSSIPVVAGDIQRTAEYLMDLFLGATQSGAAGVFLLEPETDSFIMAASRNLAYGANSLRILRTAKIASIVSKNRAPFSSTRSQNPNMRFWADRLGCDYIVPINFDGSLRGWFCLKVNHPSSRLEQSTISSLGLFAAELLKQCYSCRAALLRIERDMFLLTKISEALARIKPTGEVEVIHDENSLIAFRDGRSGGGYQKLKSSKLKAAIFKAQYGELEHFQLYHLPTQRRIEGQIHKLPDASLIVHLRWSDSLTRREHSQLGISCWKRLALDALNSYDAAAQEPRSPSLQAVLETREFLSSGILDQSLAHLLNLTRRLLPKVEVDLLAEGNALIATLPFETVGSLLLLLISIRSRQICAKNRPKLTVQLMPKGVLKLQLDFHDGRTRSSPSLDSFEAVALTGLSLNGSSTSFTQAAFGERWEVTTHLTEVPSLSNQTIQPAKALSSVSPSASQLIVNVLQDAPFAVNNSQDASNENGATAIPDNLCSARAT